MSDTTLQPPNVPLSRGGSTSSGGPPARGFAARHVWLLVAVADVVISGLLLHWARTRPGYDPYGWLDWGYQTLHGSLNLGGAPSWKPFSYIVTVPLSLLGHWALYAWMWISVSVSLAGAIFGGRIAFRLTADAGGVGDRRWASWVAAVVGGAGVLGIQQYFHYILSVQSDPMLVTVVLAAVDCLIAGRLRWSWWLGVDVALGRPEAWPFMAIFGIWLLVRRPALRWHVIAGGVITLFFWFGVPEITNGKPDIAGQLALKSPREVHGDKITGTLSRFTSLDALLLELMALVALGLAVWRRNWTVVAIAGVAAGWVVVEVAFVLHGFPGVPRYLFEPAGLTAVLAGYLIGVLLLDARTLHSRLPSWAGIPVAAILVLALIPHAISDARSEHGDIHHERARTLEINKLGAFVKALGGATKVKSCGHPVLNVEYVSVMAWYLHLNTGDIGYRPQFELKKKHPIMLFVSFPNGWGVTPVHQNGNRSCLALKSFYVPTARHPEGVLVPQ